MLSKKDLTAPVLSVVSGNSKTARKNTRRVKIVRMNKTAQTNHAATSDHLLPPVNHFNSSYFKGRDIDPL